MQTRRRKYDRTVLLAGQTLRGQDSYRVGEVIGEGGYAVVYAATSSKQVALALKEFVPGSTVSEREYVRDLYLHERDVLWGLRLHPHLPDLIEAFSQDGMHYLVLEFIQGESLRDRLAQEGPMPPSEVGPLALQLARALASLHGHGVVHHDVKPANVKVGATGLAMLLDLGSARFAGAPAGQKLRPVTQGGPAQAFIDGTASQIAGTPGYMAPELREMVESDVVTSDYRLDVFALGCTIHELITNRQLKQDDIDARNPLLIEEAVREIAQRAVELAGPAGKALSLDPEGRYPSAQELLLDLQQMIPPRPALREQEVDLDLSAGRGEVEHTLVITNAGGGSLSGTVRALQPSLAFRRPDGSRVSELAFDGNVQAVRVVADARPSSGQAEQGEILVSTPQGDLLVTCRFRRRPRTPIALVASPTEASLTVTRETVQRMTVKVRNQGGTGERVWVQVSRPGLVQVAPTECLLEPDSEVEFSIRPLARELRSGIHSLLVSFRAESGISQTGVRLTLRVRTGFWHEIGRRLFRG